MSNPELINAMMLVHEMIGDALMDRGVTRVQLGHGRPITRIDFDKKTITFGEDVGSMDQDDVKLHACNDDCGAASGSTPAQFFGQRRAGEKRVCFCECHLWNKRPADADIVTAMDGDVFTASQRYRMNESLRKAKQHTDLATQAEMDAWREKRKQSDAYLRGENLCSICGNSNKLLWYVCPNCSSESK